LLSGISDQIDFFQALTQASPTDPELEHLRKEFNIKLKMVPEYF
jgi:hypothetical protein